MLPTVGRTDACLALRVEQPGQHGRGTRGGKVGPPTNPTQQGGLVKVMSDCCNPVDYSLPGSSVHGISQARIPEWIAISFSQGPS